MVKSKRPQCRPPIHQPTHLAKCGCTTKDNNPPTIANSSRVTAGETCPSSVPTRTLFSENAISPVKHHHKTQSVTQVGPKHLYLCHGMQSQKELPANPSSPAFCFLPTAVMKSKFMMIPNPRQKAGRQHCSCQAPSYHCCSPSSQGLLPCQLLKGSMQPK